jgi:hypothetical protein
VTTPAPRALTTRFLDFWLLGGASILVWAVMMAAQPFRASWAVDQHFKNLAVTTATLSLLVNYPHFLVSYKLAYTRGTRFVTAHAWQLLIVPALLAGLFLLAYLRFDAPARSLPGIGAAAAALGGFGANARVVSGPRVGDLLFTAAFNLMLVTVGWHYTKQVFGCVMVYAKFDGYALTPAQRTLIKWSLLSVWWLTFAHTNRYGSQFTFSNFTYYGLDLPDWLVPAMETVVYAGIAAVGWFVFWENFRARGARPSLNMLAPFVALYLWWLPRTRQEEFYLLLTPLFHSLQYLAFVYRMEHARLSSHPGLEFKATALSVGLVTAGWLAFELIPNSLDVQLGTYGSWQMFFFFTAAMLFINVHHYFIDNVLWRFNDPDVRKYLLQ